MRCEGVENRGESSIMDVIQFLNFLAHAISASTKFWSYQLAALQRYSRVVVPRPQKASTKWLALVTCDSSSGTVYWVNKHGLSRVLDVLDTYVLLGLSTRVLYTWRVQLRQDEIADTSNLYADMQSRGQLVFDETLTSPLNSILLRLLNLHRSRLATFLPILFPQQMRLPPLATLRVVLKDISVLAILTLEANCVPKLR